MKPQYDHTIRWLQHTSNCNFAQWKLKEQRVKVFSILKETFNIWQLLLNHWDNATYQESGANQDRLKSLEVLWRPQDGEFHCLLCKNNPNKGVDCGRRNHGEYSLFLSLDILETPSRQREQTSILRRSRNASSSPRAESTRAVTGRRCPHSGRGEDFLSRQPDFFTETAVTLDRKVEKLFPRWEINRHVEG